MSELHASSDHIRAMQARRAQGPGQWIALSAAIALSCVAAAAVWSRDSQPDWAMALLSLFAVAGVGSLYALGFGVLRFGRDHPKADWCAMLCASGEAAAITSARGELLFSNPAFAGLGGGVDGPHARPHDILAAVGDDGATVFRFASAAARGEAHDETVTLNRGPRGDMPCCLRVGMVPLPERRNGRGVLAWHFTDISKEAGALSDANRQKTRYRGWFDAVPAGVILADETGRVRGMNAAMRKLLSRAARKAGQDIGLEDIFSDASLHLLKALPVSQNGASTPRTARLELLQDGNAPLPIWAAFRHVEDDDGNASSLCITLMRGIDADVAPQVSAPDQAIMSQYFHSAPVAIASVNQSGRVSNANSAFHQTFGAHGARRGKPLSLAELVAPQSREAVIQLLKDAVQRRAPKAPVDIVFRGEPKRSGQLYVVPFEKGSARRGRDVAVIYAIDTSEQRRLEEQIAQNQKMQEVGQLAGGIAHDFNNVLQAIIGYADLMLANHRPSDPAFSDIMHIRNNANRAAALVGHLLAYSRSQTLRPKVWSLTDIIEEFSQLLGRLLGEKVTANVVHGRDLWLVKADANQLEQVIMNLAVNARDAMLPDGGELKIRTTNVTERESLQLGASGVEPGEYVLLEVSDNGCGMPPEVMSKIFEPFFSTKEIGEGTGFGLSVVHGIVKQTGGYILVDSRVGEGTTFRIYLPRHVDEEDHLADAGEEPAKKDVQRDLTGSGTILLVEDEEEVRGFAARALSMRGYRVLQAATGVDALEVIAGYDGVIDLMITDVMMPQMDGPSLFRQVRKSAPDMKVIFMSGYAEQSLREGLTEGENVNFLPKPFSLKRLAELVKQVLD